MSIESRIEKRGTSAESGRTDGRFWRYAPVIGWMAVIFYASTGAFAAANTSRIIEPVLRFVYPAISREGLDFSHFLVRKAAHLTEYAILALLTARAFLGSPGAILRRYWFPIALGVVAIYALSDEYHQSFEPTRTASIYDSMLDTTGGLIALIALGLVNSVRVRRVDRH